MREVRRSLESGAARRRLTIQLQALTRNEGIRRERILRNEAPKPTE
jgi:hypothetical protein